MSKVYIEKSRSVNYQNVKAGIEGDCKTQGDVDLLEASVDKLIDRMYEKYEKLQPANKPASSNTGSSNTGSSNRTTSVTNVLCPECGGDMWDNRKKKANGEFSSKSPDYACKDKNCNGALWGDSDADNGDIDIDDIPF
jgi:hypothetical protein